MPRCFSSSINRKSHGGWPCAPAPRPPPGWRRRTEQLLGQGRFTRVGVGNDGEGAAAGDFGVWGHGGLRNGAKGRIIPPLPPSPGIGSQAATILALCRAMAAATPRRSRQRR